MEKLVASKDQLIIALDFPTSEEAIQLVDAIGTSASYYKVGLELFLNSRGRVLDELKARDKKIFLDLKFHDIPNTTAQACRWAAGLGVDMFNVHAGGGLEMMQRAREATAEGALSKGLGVPKLIAVTILTSFDQEGLDKVGYRGTIDENVKRLAALTNEAGLDGVVCSSREVGLIRQAVEDEAFLTVCPGVRPLWAAKGDQKRIMTPAQAIEQGVNHMVVGRPITKAENPVEAVKKILEEMNVTEV